MPMAIFSASIWSIAACSSHSAVGFLDTPAFVNKSLGPSPGNKGAEATISKSAWRNFLTEAFALAEVFLEKAAIFEVMPSMVAAVAAAGVLYSGFCCSARLGGNVGEFDNKGFSTSLALPCGLPFFCAVLLRTLCVFALGLLA